MRLYCFIHKSAILIIVFISINHIFYLIEIYYHLKIFVKEKKIMENKVKFSFFFCFEYEIITLYGKIICSVKNAFFKKITDCFIVEAKNII